MYLSLNREHKYSSLLFAWIYWTLYYLQMTNSSIITEGQFPVVRKLIQPWCKTIRVHFICIDLLIISNKRFKNMRTSNIKMIDITTIYCNINRIPFKLPFSSKSLLAMFLPPEVLIGGKEDIAAPSSRPKEYNIKRYTIPNENSITTVLPVLPWLKIII